MPLIKCPACEKDISAQASSCPNCGHPLAKSDANKPQSKSRLGWLVLILVVVLLVGIALSSGDHTTQRTAQEDSCRSDWTKCVDNEQLVNRYSDWSNIQMECKHAANDRAKYGNPNWPWLSFGTFHTGNNHAYPVDTQVYHW
jgi:hypothetical protein